MQDLQKKRDREQALVQQMIQLYCARRHHTDGGLCPDCQALSDYAAQRVQRCPVMAQKTFCSRCQIHCYQPAMRRQIQTVMRFAGPRMLFYHPLMVLRHALQGKKHRSEAKP